MAHFANLTIAFCSMMKNGLSLFNELSRENYDITELDDGADLTGTFSRPFLSLSIQVETKFHCFYLSNPK